MARIARVSLIGDPRELSNFEDRLSALEDLWAAIKDAADSPVGYSPKVSRSLQSFERDGEITMPKFEIKSRWDDSILHTVEADTYREALEKLCKSGANLSGANLSGADLSRADLYGANLSRANLSGADLSRADLSRANLSGANLSGADLSGANLYGADLYGADLYGADLKEDTVLPAGETWKEYREQVVPALLAAGGKPFKEVVDAAWECHAWENCPIATAFSVHSIAEVPILLRPRAQQFIQFFDARLLPKPEVKE